MKGKRGKRLDKHAEKKREKQGKDREKKRFYFTTIE